MQNDYERRKMEVQLKKQMATIVLTMRLPAGLKEIIYERSKKEFRSPNQEILLLLCKALNIDPMIYYNH